MKDKKFNAFTLAEMIIALVAIGVLVVMTLKIVLKQTPDKEKALFKKAYTQLEMNVAELINDDELYPDDSGFANTLSIEDIKKGESYGKSKTVEYASITADALKNLNKTIDDIIKYVNGDTSVKFTTGHKILIDQLCKTYLPNLLLSYDEGTADYITLNTQKEFCNTIYFKVGQFVGGSSDTLQITSDEAARLKNIQTNTVNGLLAGTIGTTHIKVASSDYDSNSKFNDVVKSKMNVFEDNISCRFATGANSQMYSNSCFMTDDGVVYGIPDTNFANENVFSIEQDGDTLKYVPVTMYVNWDKVKNKQGENSIVEKEGIIVGVRFNGGIRLLNTVDCTNNSYKNYKQCQAVEYLKSNTIKTTKDKK